jgi:uncharacterized protein
MAMTDLQRSAILAALRDATGFRPQQIDNSIRLLDEGATIPFIARYRKEQTGELDEVQLRYLAELYSYQTELETRKNVILASIGEQGKLTDELSARIAACRVKTELEDLYLPYKPKRRTKAQIARERGLEPLADLMAAQELTSGTPESAAQPFVDPEREVPDAAAALIGAGHILAERLADHAESRAFVRQQTWQEGVLCSRVASEYTGKPSKFEMYYDYEEPIRTIPSHRLLAMRRGEKEEVLFLTLRAPQEQILAGLTSRLVVRPSIFRQHLEAIAVDAYKRLIAPSIEVELRLKAKEQADAIAIGVFGDNLKSLLLQAPAGARPVLGIDPGLRTGSKIAVIDATGKLLAHATIYPHTGGEGSRSAARQTLLDFLKRHPSELIAIGNGTAGREMEQFVRETLTGTGHAIPIVIVNEAGASVYSASDLAREEFPDLDLTIRGAVSIARRLQDPLAELVKIDPKSIGVGQYQHDVDQKALQEKLGSIVESCVNHVGVDLNTASWALLAYVSGIGPALARAIVQHRDANGPFPDRKAIMAVPRFGAKAFEQAAGFLRIRSGTQPLDNTAVHPERYPLVARMAADLGLTIPQLIAAPERLAAIDLRRYATDEVGLPTLTDIVTELKRPGRDPRPAFRTATLRDDIREIGDLRSGLVLEGTVTNVAAFGAFVDIGVHQDGLVHVSHLANRFIKDPHTVVKVGDIVTVQVLDVDPVRKRISLSMKAAQR